MPCKSKRLELPVPGAGRGSLLLCNGMPTGAPPLRNKTTLSIGLHQVADQYSASILFSCFVQIIILSLRNLLCDTAWLVGTDGTENAHRKHL